jgi:SAM-dependent methyltransferase
MSWFSNVVLQRARGSADLLPKIAAQARELRSDGRRKVTGRDVLLLHMPRGGRGVEIGVWRGEFSRLLLERLQPEHLSLVDPWPAPDVADRVYPGGVIPDQAGADDVYASVVAALGTDPRVAIVRKASLEAAPHFADGSLDWVYVDGLHYYEDVRDDLAAWAPKLKPGGALCGDDYYWRDKGALPVKRAVDEWIAANNPAAWFTFRGQFYIKLR